MTPETTKTDAELLDGVERRPNGRVVIYSRTTGRSYERYEDQALEMLRSGEFATARPDGITVPVIPAPTNVAGMPALSLVPPSSPSPDPAELERQAQFRELVDGGIPEDEARALVWPQA